MAYNLEPRTIKENLLGLIGKNPHAEPRPANTREECFLADIAENGGGLPEVTSDDNGDVLTVVDGEWSKAPAPSSLPPYTSADKGKVLGLGEGEPEPSVIVPEQTVTYDSGVPLIPLQNVAIDPSSMTVGDTGVLYVTFDGSTYQYPMTVVSEEGTTGYMWSNDEVGESIFIFYYPSASGWVVNIQVLEQPFDDGDTISIRLTASVPSVEPKWEAASGRIKVMKCYTGEIPRKTGGGEIDAPVSIWRLAASIAGNDINTFRAAVVDHSEYEKLTADDSVVIVDFSNGDLFFPVAAPSVFGRNELGASVTIGPPSDYLFESGTWLEPKEQSTITFAYFNPQIADIQSNSAVPVLIIDASAVVFEELQT